MEYMQYQGNYDNEYYEDGLGYGDYLPQVDYPYEYGGTAHSAQLLHLRLDQFVFMQEWKNLLENCMGPVVLQSLSQVKVLLLTSFVIRLLIVVLNTLSHIPLRVRSNVIHCIWAASGFIVIHSIDSYNFLNIVQVISLYAALAYAVLYILTSVKKSVGATISLISVAFIIGGEALMNHPELWHRIRGIVLLLAMKIMSLTFDLDKKIENFPNAFAYFGYCMHAGTLLFGPWISISDYTDSVLNPKPMTASWLLYILKSLLQAFVCLVLSTCVFTYLFIDKNQPEIPALLPFAGGVWLMSYKDALSFHFSHYYISYLSQGICMLSGVGSNQAISCSAWSDFVITRPLVVEFPTSMLNVVIGWNIPMSRWLKTYIFNTYQYLGRPVAILLTYVASALLHGLSFHLAAILMSLAFFTYVEHELRLKLSLIFNCKHIQARRRPEHQESLAPFWARLFNLGWVLINLMHLSYLGSIFYSEDDNMEREGFAMKHTLDKWSNLSYFSHLFAVGCFLFNYLI